MIAFFPLVSLALAAISAAALWFAPLLGLLATAITLAIVPPWGRGLIERAVISGIVFTGGVALIFPRSGSTPIDHTTARLFLIALLVLALALRLIPRLRTTPIPRPTWTDAVVIVTVALAAWWPISAYWGVDAAGTLSGLLFSGWDNHGHFTTFANTYMAGSTTWPTVDGSLAWNQWYPSLHTTMWALLQYAGSNADLTRIELLQPFVMFSAVTFAACVGALTWMAADIARRWRNSAGAGLLAALGFAVFALLGSMQNLFQSGFTNFVLALTLTATASYLSARTWRSARTIGWFLVPLAAIAVIGLWTPLVIGLVPAGLVVTIALWRHSRPWGIAYLIAAGAAGVFILFTQSSAVLGASDASLGEFSEIVGGVDTGMAEFNLGAGIAAPALALLLALLLWRTRAPAQSHPAPIGLAAPALGAGAVATFFAAGAYSAGVSWIVSYYVLKSLDAAYVMAAPFAIAALAAGTMVLLQRIRASQTGGNLTSALAVATVALLAITAFGYVGALPVPLSEGSTAAPGIANAADRSEFVTRSTGVPLINAVRTASLTPDYMPLLWNDSGTLPNLWVGSLTGTLSTDQQQVYLNLPPYPYDAAAAESVRSRSTMYPKVNINLLWTETASAPLLLPLAGLSDQIIVTQVLTPAD